ncbi:hypothetical protein Sjap_010308 [Stephania japonica]|uniref:Uncharacterized protein n=1 Tax=Stephania japonica TaxID=461633 RepID=A0AAP0P707_9MAGN
MRRFNRLRCRFVMGRSVKEDLVVECLTLMKKGIFVQLRGALRNLMGAFVNGDMAGLTSKIDRSSVGPLSACYYYSFLKFGFQTDSKLANITETGLSISHPKAELDSADSPFAVRVLTGLESSGKDSSMLGRVLD